MEGFMSAVETSPEFQKEVLAVRAQVAVILAEKKVSLATLLDLVPGSMLQFERPYHAPLSLEVGGQPIALGEAVKVDDKFGFRIKSMGLPEED